MAEVQTERPRAENDLAAAPGVKLTTEQVRSMVEGLGNIAAEMADAEPKLKSRLYEELGISVSYNHTDQECRRRVRAEPRVGKGQCRRGDLNPHTLAGTSPLIRAPVLVYRVVPVRPMYGAPRRDTGRHGFPCRNCTLLHAGPGLYHWAMLWPLSRMPALDAARCPCPKHVSAASVGGGLRLVLAITKPQLPSTDSKP